MSQKGFLLHRWLPHVGPDFPVPKKFSILLICNLILAQLSASCVNWTALSPALSLLLGVNTLLQVYLLHCCVLWSHMEMSTKGRLGPVKWKEKRGQKKRKREKKNLSKGRQREH